jgi:hypothetical protein
MTRLVETTQVGTAHQVCVSCSQPLTGPYCASCGEPVLDPESRTVRHFLTRTLPEEAFDIDSKLWRTLRSLLLVPGFLSSEYSAGRRRRNLSPLRLLLTAIVIFALGTQGGFIAVVRVGNVALSIAPTAVSTGASIADTVAMLDRFGLLAPRLAAKQQTTDLTAEATRQRFHAALNRFAQPVSFTNVVMMAFALHVAFRRRRPLLVENAAFSAHLVSFVLLSSLPLVPVPRVIAVNPAPGMVLILGVFIWQYLYIASAVRRYYFADATPESWPRLRAHLAALLIYLVNALFVTVVQMIGAAIAIRGL